MFLDEQWVRTSDYFDTALPPSGVIVEGSGNKFMINNTNKGGFGVSASRKLS